MNYPLISEYVEVIKSAEDNFEELSYLRPVMGDDGLPVMTSGNFAVVFKMKDEQSGKFYAVKCFTKEQEGRAEAYREIAKELKNVSSPYLVSIQYLEKELFVDTDQTTETEFPVLLMDWVEGKTLDKYLRENLDDKYALEMLAYRFSQLAQWLIPQPFAHGDLKPDNIIVREDGSIVLVDYDGMYVPSMKGQNAREIGSEDFRHPLRTVAHFNNSIDVFSILSILLSLKAFAINPNFYNIYAKSNRLLFSYKDYCNIKHCKLIKIIDMIEDPELKRLTWLLERSIEQFGEQKQSIIIIELLSGLHFHRPRRKYTNLTTIINKEELIFDNTWRDEKSVRYSKDRKKLLKGPIIDFIKYSYSVHVDTKVICNNAFSTCHGFEIVHLPNGLILIGDYAFSNCWQLRNINIPNTVIDIGHNAFKGCGFENLVIPNSIKGIGERAFAECHELNEITLPDGINRLEKAVFSGCYNLKKIIIPDGVDTIADDAFYRCSSLSEMALPNTLTIIGDYAFSFCSSLTRVTLPNSLKIIGDNAFSGCSGLTSISVASGNTKYDSRNNCNAIIETASNTLITGCKNTTIPNSVTSIGGFAFNGCSGLTSVAIPNSVTSIGGFAFNGCSGLTSVAIPNSVTSIGYQAFRDCKKIETIILPNGIREIGEKPFVGCENLMAIVVPKGTKCLYEYLLPDDRDKIIEPESEIEELSTKVTKEDWNNIWMDEYGAAYSRDNKRLLKCPKIKSYNIKEGTKVVADQAFKGCMEIQEVQIPSSVELIGAQAFDSCWKLEKLEIPNSVKFIGKGCFDSCSSLQEMKIPEGITKIEDSTFAGCYKLQKVILPNSLLEIGSYAFQICSMNEIELPKQLKTIGYNAFWKANITKLIIPNSVNRIDAGAFWHCSSLESITLPPSISEIKDETFFFCTKLSVIELPKSIKKIGRSAFDGAKSLQKVVVPEGVSRIESAAFAACYSLEEITLPSSISYVGDKVFIDCPRLKKIRIPKGSKSIYVKFIPNYMNKVYEE